MGTEHQYDAVPEAPPPPAWEAFRHQFPLWGDIVGYILAPVVFILMAWGGYAVGSWGGLAYWIVMLTVGGFVFICLLVIATEIRFHIKRSDTATQTLRAASQGRVELIGTIRPLDGPVISPLYGVSCAAFWSRIIAKPRQWPEGWPAGRAKPADVYMQDKYVPAAVLLTDGKAEAFVPYSDTFRGDSDVRLDKLDAPHDLLREDVRASVAEGEWEITHRTEYVIPCDTPLQLNGLFRTLSSRDSYLEVVNKHTDILPPTPEQLETSPLEQAWRAYCARREAAAMENGGSTEAAPVDAILPITNYKRISLVRPADAGGWAAWRTIHIMVMFIVPSVYVLLRLPDLIEPLPFLF